MFEALTFQAGHNATVVSLGTIALGVGAGLLGVFALLRGRALAADAIAHAALPGFAGAFLIAAIFGVAGKSLLILGPGAVIAALCALLLIRRLSQTATLKPDAAIGTVLAGAYALGIVLLSIVQTLPTGGQAGLATYLIGSSAGMLAAEAMTNAGVAVVILVAVIALYKEFAALAFDSEGATLAGLPTGVLDGVLTGLLLLLAIAALPSVGSILFVALVVIPAATARLLAERLSTMSMIAALVAGLGAHIGVAASSATTRLPTGPAIVLVLAFAFVLALLFSPRRGLIARRLSDRAARAALRAELLAETGRARG